MEDRTAARIARLGRRERVDTSTAGKRLVGPDALENDNPGLLAGRGTGMRQHLPLFIAEFDELVFGDAQRRQIIGMQAGGGALFALA